MIDLSRRDPSTKTRGADNVTMLLWLMIERAPGITRDALVDRAGSRVPEGHAKRRYTAYLDSQHRSRGGGANRVAPPPAFEDLNVAKARRHLITTALRNMRRDGSIERDHNGSYRALRRPKTDEYQENDDVIDVTGELTRHHMRKAEAIRTLKGARQRFATTQQRRLSRTEGEALATLLDLLDDELIRSEGE